MYKSFLWFLIFGPSISFGQRYRTIDLLKKADSLIISVVGQEIFTEHYQLDTTLVTDPVQIAIDKDAGIRRVSLTQKTNRIIKFISVDYIFYIKKPDSPFVHTGLILDKNLNLQYPVDTSFIPKFIYQKTTDTFLTKDQATNIARLRFKKKGLKIESRISYDPKQKIYIWEVTNIISEHQGGRSVEHLILNAQSGKVIDFYEGLQTEIH